MAARPMLCMILGVGISSVAGLTSPAHRFFRAPSAGRLRRQVTDGEPALGARAVHMAAGGDVTRDLGSDTGGEGSNTAPAGRVENRDCPRGQCRKWGHCMSTHLGEAEVYVAGGGGQCMCAPGTCSPRPPRNDGTDNCYHPSHAGLAGNRYVVPTAVDGPQQCECNVSTTCMLNDKCELLELHGQHMQYVADDQGQCKCAPGTCVIPQADTGGALQCYHSALAAHYQHKWADPTGTDGTQQCECNAETTCQMGGQCHLLRRYGREQYTAGNQGQCVCLTGQCKLDNSCLDSLWGYSADESGDCFCPEGKCIRYGRCQDPGSNFVIGAGQRCEWNHW